LSYGPSPAVSIPNREQLQLRVPFYSI